MPFASELSADGECRSSMMQRAAMAMLQEDSRQTAHLQGMVARVKVLQVDVQRLKDAIRATQDPLVRSAMLAIPGNTAAQLDRFKDKLVCDLTLVQTQLHHLLSMLHNAVS
jgi:hypothetical protein